MIAPLPRCLLGLLLAFPLVAMAQAQADSFLQGPERAGHARALAGTVIGVHRDLERTCHVVLADRPDPAWAGLGGGGRFFWCVAHSQALGMGQRLDVAGVQEGTRLARMGPRWRVLPLFVPGR